MSNRRPQSQKPRELTRVYRVQDLRRSSASEPIPSGARYNRATFRNQAQRGLYMED